MAFFRKAGNILGRTVNNHTSSEISSSKPSIFQAIRYMSSSNIFVGGLSYSTDDTNLREVFSKYGEVYEAKVIIDRDTGRSRGFGFVNYSSVEEASAAIQALDQQELHGRRVRVNYANERTRSYGGGEGFRGGNFGGGDNSGGFGGNYGTGGGYNSSGGFGGNYGTGGGYNNSDGYGTGSYGTGENPNFGVNNYGSGVETAAYPTNGGDSHTGGGNYAVTNSFDGGNLSYGGNGQNFGGGSGGDNLFGNGGSSSASSGYDGFGDKFGSKESNGLGKDDRLEGNYRDDDDIPGSYADRRG